MSHADNPKRSLSELIERSSLGSPRARALRQVVAPEVAAKLVARSTARGPKLNSRSRRNSSR